MRTRSAVGLALLAFVPACENGTTTNANGRSLTLLYTMDEHSHQFAFGPEADDFPAATTAGTGQLRGGVARRKVLLDRERMSAMTSGADVLTVSGGDTTSGTLSEVDFPRAASDYTLLKQLGYDVVTLGNHEFDFTPAGLAAAVSAATAKGGAPQIVSTNIHFDAMDPGDDTLAALYGEGTGSKPIKRYHVVKTSSGLKVGFIGVVGASAAYVAPLKKPVRFSGTYDIESKTDMVMPLIYADLQPTVDALRNTEKVDLVVALSHSGLYSTNYEKNEDYLIAQNVSGIDVIVSGHAHDKLDAPITVKNTKTGKNVVIVIGGAYGIYLGRLPLNVANDGSVSFDAANAKLLVVDDTVVPDATVAASLSSIVSDIESTPLMNGTSFLEGALSSILGMKVTHDPSKVGSLYFYKLGSTTYDIQGLVGGRTSTPFETNMLNLVADAERAAVQSALPNEKPVDLALQGAAVIRADLQAGKTGALGFSDIFRILPLGSSPMDGSTGYPLVSAYLYLAEIKGAFELAASTGLVNSDFFLGASGMRVTVDTSRAAYDQSKPFDAMNGRVVKIEWDSKHNMGMDTYDKTLFDVSVPALADLTGGPYHIATNFYLASFASAAGVILFDKNQIAVPKEMTPTLIVKRTDGSQWRDYEALASYIKQISDANGGSLPDRYNASKPSGTVPRRILCSGPLCQR